MTSGGERKEFAFMVDARKAGLIDEFPTTWARLAEVADQGTLAARPLLLFLDCNGDVLVRRFQETRCRRPLDVSDDGGSQIGESGLCTALAAERALLADVKTRADTIINTRGFSGHELKRLVHERFGGDGSLLMVTLLSFGFKHGVPAELDLCCDVLPREPLRIGLFSSCSALICWRVRGCAGSAPSRFQSTRRRALWNTQGQVVVAGGWVSV